MASNEFLPFGTAGGANVISQAVFASLPARLQGFVAGVALSAQLNKVWRQSSVMSSMLGEFILDYGGLDALDNGDVDALETAFVRTLQKQGWSFGATSGSANAWVVAPVPAVAAYISGRPLYLQAPATNTSTTVNANISTLGSRRIKKRDGSDPAIGDLVAGTWYLTIDDGTSIIVVSPLISDIVGAINAAPTPPTLNYFDLSTQNTQTVTNAVVTVVNDFAVIASKPSDAVFSAGGLITIGPRTAGVWAFNQTYSPSQVGGVSSVTQAYIQKNGIAYNNQTVSGTFATNSGTIRVAAGDILRMTIYQNSGTNQKNQHPPVLPFTTTFNLSQISGP